MARLKIAVTAFFSTGVQYTIPIYVPTSRQVTQARITKTQKGRFEKRLSAPADVVLIESPPVKIDHELPGTGMLAQ